MKKFIIGLVIIISVFGILIFSAAPSLTTYRDKDNFSDSYNKYCGYLIHCQYYDYYKPGTLVIEIHQPESTDDRDYYYNYKGIRCKSNLDIKLINAKFINPNDTIHFQESRQGKYIALESKIPKEKIGSHEKLELRVSFTTGQPDKTIILERYTGKDFNTKDTWIYILLCIILIFTYALWLILSVVLSKTLTQHSLLLIRIIAGIVTVALLFILIKYLETLIVF